MAASSPPTANAQSKAAQLISALPAKNAEEGNRINAQLVKLGPKAAQSICEMLVPPGTGDDTKARYALHNLCWYAQRPGAEQERSMLAGALINAIAAAKDDEVRAFLIRQLQLIGKKEALAPLGKLLSDERALRTSGPGPAPDRSSRHRRSLQQGPAIRQRQNPPDPPARPRPTPRRKRRGRYPPLREKRRPRNPPGRPLRPRKYRRPQLGRRPRRRHPHRIPPRTRQGHLIPAPPRPTPGRSRQNRRIRENLPRTHPRPNRPRR